jgi:predicted nucleic acid-binding protein
MRVFVDTNTLLDVLAKREPFYSASARIWTMAESAEIEAHISAISFNNVYYVVRKLKDRKSADRAVCVMRDVFRPVAPDEQILNQAIDSRMKDFEDAIQYFSAIRIQADHLITRNPDDFPRDPVPVLSPEEFLAMAETVEKKEGP